MSNNDPLDFFLSRISLLMLSISRDQSMIAWQQVVFVVWIRAVHDRTLATDRVHDGVLWVVMDVGCAVWL